MYFLYSVHYYIRWICFRDAWKRWSCCHPKWWIQDTACSYTYTELISNNSSSTNWYPLAQQPLCGRRYRLLRLITLILPATSKGYSEDYLHKNDATMIVLTSNHDSTYKAQKRYWEVAMIVLTRRKSAETPINTGDVRGEECFWKWLTLLYHCHRTIVSALFQSFLGSEFLQEKGHSLFVLWICRIQYQPFPLPTLQISYLHG